MIPLVDLKRQYALLREDLQTAIQWVMETSVFINGPHTKQFEQKFARASGARYGVGTSSGTTALHLTLAALGIGLGDEVITVPNTFIATAEAITMTGASVRFVDVDPQSYTMDPHKLAKAITDKTRALIPVDLYGQPCDRKMIAKIAEQHDLFVVYDAAQAHLAEFGGKPLGGFGDAVCYSFFPGKNLGACGDAGMVTTNNLELERRLRMLANHGRMEKYTHQVPGFNYRMDEIQAAVLDVKLTHLPAWTKRRRQIAQLYDIILSGCPVVTPWVDERVNPVYHLYVVRLKNRDAIKSALADIGIATGIHYPVCLHCQEAYSHLGYQKGDFPIAEKYADTILSLPMFPELTDDEVTTIGKIVRQQVAGGGAQVSGARLTPLSAKG